MIKFGGVNALAPFEQKTLLTELKKIDSKIQNVSAEYIHFVKTDSLSKSDEKKLKVLLHYDTPYLDNKSGQQLLVLPRFGTISPWSSKAKDIAKNCGLKTIERIERGTAYYVKSLSNINTKIIGKLLYDRMTQIVVTDVSEAEKLFVYNEPKPYKEIDIIAEGKKAFNKANKQFGLALSDDEIEYLFKAYSKIKRNPTDVELMMFAVVNSEHCRHKIFNAKWVVDGKTITKSLFKMIKNTHESYSENILSAYSDNAAVLKGPKTKQFFVNKKKQKYEYSNEPANLVIKVETHNHPTAIAPYSGGATGVGGEIRDEAATGRGARSKMGLTGFNVSNLNLPQSKQTWEKNYGKPNRIVSALEIMLEAPLGGSGYANEFGRPNLLGYFRTYEQEVSGDVRGYHKPIMIAGGLGNIRDKHIKKNQIKSGDKLIILGGPSMLIGLGGGSASSLETGKSDANLDFASVQRDNAELQRRTQEVISTCWSLGENNPIISIHDVGAGGISNAFPELVHNNGLGARFELRDIPNSEPGMSPMEIWCNEAQERFVLAVNKDYVAFFTEICDRERCPFAVVGNATKEKKLVLSDRKFKNNPIDIPIDLIFGNPPKLTKSFNASALKLDGLKLSDIKIDDAVRKVLSLPSVASKKFLITIGDRTVGGLVTRDQMIGKWQIPVSNVAVTASSYFAKTGEAAAMGERPQLALINPSASARIAVGEAITNIAAANINKLNDVKLSANWMAASGYKNEDQALFEAVKTLGEEFCIDLGIAIPVGKDSLSMRTVWDDKSVTAPMSVVISAFAPVVDTFKTLTPDLQNVESRLILIDLGQGKNRLGGSALAQVYNQIGNESPDIEPSLLKNFFNSIQKLNAGNKILAYHDRSDGGLFTTLVEMSFTSRLGLNINLMNFQGLALEILFSEELGAVIQVRAEDAGEVLIELKEKMNGSAYDIGSISQKLEIIIKNGKDLVYKNTRVALESLWASTSYQIQKLRDNPESAKSEFELISDNNDPGLSPKITFDYPTSNLQPLTSERPKVAILREQGVNGHFEMAAAFDLAGFDSYDVHLNDLADKSSSLDKFSVLAVCGGFSYGDVLGAGQGFSKSILFNDYLRGQFQTFFERKDTLTLGICNGCQMLSDLKEIIPGANHWPEFLTNKSGRFEARLVSVKISKSPSVFLKNMEGSILPVPTAHGEGRAVFKNANSLDYSLKNNLVSAQFVDNSGKITEAYPLNPNGSEQGITALTSKDGRATIIMPHPERVFLTKQLSWHPKNWPEQSPWLKIFQNARDWVG